MESYSVKGMVIKSSDVGDYDKRLVILTKEKGKIVAFARGARRVKSPLIAGTRLFSFGEFEVYEGKDSYSLIKCDIKEGFEDISGDIEAMCYGSYFLELLDYFSVEGVRAGNSINLMYITLKALMNENIPNDLVKCIFELRILLENGEYPEVFKCVKCGKSKELISFSALSNGMLCSDCDVKVKDGMELNKSTIYTMQYILSSDLKHLYTFVVKDNVLSELNAVMKRYMSLHIDREFKSLEILRTVTNRQN